jgi:6-phosphogluconolactonase
MKFFFSLLCLTFFSALSGYAQKKAILYVGTYTGKGSDGIYTLQFDTKNGQLSSLHSTKNIVNPTFLTISANKKYLYAVSEIGPEGRVYAYQIQENSGKLTELNYVSSGGSGPCHVVVDKNTQWVYTGNYGGGNWSSLPVLDDGKLGNPLQTFQHIGKSINEKRQENPHVHSVHIAPNQLDIFVADLGTDTLYHYRKDAKTGLIARGQSSQKITSGGGPRHIRFHPNGQNLYVVQELTGRVSVYNYEDNQLQFIQEISTLPAGFTGNNSSADLHFSPDGSFLYVSNRFFDTLCIFEVLPDGRLKQLGQEAVVGKTPRNFTLSPDGRFILVANQDSDSITVFKRNKKTGFMTYSHSFEGISMPVCLQFLP